MADRLPSVVGVMVLAVSVALLGVGFYTVYEVVKDPSGRLHGLANSLNVSTTGPTASFTWISDGYSVTFNDTSTDNGSTITVWAWEFGDGTYNDSRTPGPHVYHATCTVCSETVALAVRDKAGREAATVANVVIQTTGESNGSSRSPAFELGIPNFGPLTSGLPGMLELLVVMFLIGGSAAKASWNLLRREPQPVPVPVRARPPVER